MTYKYIYHISDLHIKCIDSTKCKNNFEEIKYAIINVIKYIDSPNESLIVITGDLFHYINKINNDILLFINEIINILTNKCKTIIILGNHDVVPNNENNDLKILFMKFISYINKNVILLTSENEYVLDNIIFIPTLFYSQSIKQPQYKTTKTLISLFHNEINGCIYNYNNQNHISDYYIKKSDFDKFDLVLLGHIHTHQFLQKNMAYSGSLIQTNFGEEINNQGFIKWDIQNKSGKFIKIHQNTSYITVTNDNYDKLNYPPNSHIRLIINNTMSDINQIKEYIDKQTNVLTFTQLYQFKARKNKISSIQNKLTLTSDNDIINIISSNLEETNKIDILNIMSSMLKKINFKYNITPKIFKLNTLSFDNLMTYGEKNKINFNNLNGIIGLVAPNHSGKSSIIDILIYSLYKKVLRGKNNDIINIKHLGDKFGSCVNFNINNNTYDIKRYGKRIKSSYSKKIEIKINDLIQDTKSLNNNESEYIENIICDLDTFINSSIILQNNKGFLDLSPKDKRDMLFSIFNLNIFDEIMRMLYKYKKDTNVIIKDRKESLQKFISSHQCIYKDDNIYTVNELEDDIYKLSTDIKQYTDKIDKYRKFIKQIPDNINILDKIITKQQYLDNIEKIDKLEIEIKQLKDEKNIIQTELNDYLIKYNVTNDKFNFKISLDEFNKLPEEIIKLNELLNNKKNKLKSYTKYDVNDIKINQYDLNHIDYDDVCNKIKYYNNELSKIQIQLHELKGYLTNKHITKYDNYKKITKSQHDFNIMLLNKLKIRKQRVTDLYDKYVSFYNDSLKQLLSAKRRLYNKINSLKQDFNKYNDLLKSSLSLNIPQITFPNINSYYNKHKNILNNIDDYITLSNITDINIKCKYCVKNNKDKLRSIKDKSIIKLPYNIIKNNLCVCNKYIDLLNNINITYSKINYIPINILYYDYLHYVESYDLVNSTISKLENSNIKHMYISCIDNLNIKINELSRDIDCFNNQDYYEKVDEYKILELKKNDIVKNIDNLTNIKQAYEYYKYNKIIGKINKINDTIKLLHNKQQCYINDQYLKLKHKLDNIKLDINNKYNEISILNNQQYNYINDKNIHYTGKIAKLEQNILILQDKISSNNKIITYLDLYNNMQNDINQYDQKNSYYSILEQLFKDQGTISSIIESLLLELENEINSILYELAEFNIKIHYDIKNGIDIYKIINNNIEISANQLSGFEKEVVNILFKIVLNKFNTKFTSNFLIIDEGFTSYDSKHLSHIDKLMSLLKSNYKFVLIISHIDTLKDYFDQIITIDINNDSHIFV